MLPLRGRWSAFAFLTIVALSLVLACSVSAEGPATTSFDDYLLTWKPTSTTDAAGAQATRPPRDVLEALQQLMAQDQAMILERLPDRPSLRLRLTADAARQLGSLQEVASLERLGSRPPAPPQPPQSTPEVPTPGALGRNASYSISGTVYDANGAPVPYAYVSTDYSDPSYTAAAADANGVYTLTVSAAGIYHVSASNYPWPDTPERTVTVPPNRTGQDLQFPATYTIVGTVRTAANTPVSGASVSTASDDPASAYFYTGADGVYTLTVAAGTYHIHASKTGWPNTPERTVTVPPDQTGQDLQFPAIYTVVGTVRTADSIPVAGAYVSTASGDPASAYYYTEADGVYTLTLTAGTYHIHASKGNWPETPERTVTVPPNRTGQDLQFPALYTIVGTVRTAANAPVPDAYVTTTYGDPVYAYSSCDSRGVYTLTVIAGTYHIRASRGDWPSTPVRTVTVPPNRTGQDLQFPALYTIIGTVRRPGGAPLAGVYVSTDWNDPLYASDSSDYRGVYTLTVIAGSYNLSASWTGYPDVGHCNVVVPPSKTGVDLTFAGDYTIVGTVRDHLGNPVAGAWVRTNYNDRVSVDAQTDARGVYTLTLYAGTYHLSVSKDGYPNREMRTVTVPPSQPGQDFSLPPTYLIRGTVRDHASLPVDDIQVRTSDGDPVYASAYTQAGGAYTLTVIAGTYRVHAGGTDYPNNVLVQVTVPPNRSGVGITLPQIFEIRGTVRDSHGTPLGGSQVSASPIVCGNVGGDAYPAADGTYTLRLPAGTYDMAVTRDRYAATSTGPLVVSADANNVDWTIPLPTRYTVRGHVYGTGGTPLEHAGITATSCGLPGDDVLSVVGGAYTLTLAAGTYDLTASDSTDGYGSSSRSVVVAGPLVGVDFNLSPGWRISGQVADVAGHPVTGIWVQATSGSGGGSDNTNICGLYSLLVPNPGSYKVSASRGMAKTNERTVAVPPDQPHTDLTLGAVPTTYPVVVSVVDQVGQPVLDATVWACPTTVGNCIDPVQSLYNGRAMLYLPAGDWDISANEGCYISLPTTAIHVPTTSTMTATLHRATQRVTGHVYASGGAPLYNASVSASSSHGFAWSNTDSLGRYLLRLCPTTWNLTASACSYQQQRITGVVVPPDRTGVDFTLGTSGTPTPTATRTATPTGTRQATVTSTSTPTRTLVPTKTSTPTPTRKGPTLTPGPTGAYGVSLPLVLKGS